MVCQACGNEVEPGGRFCPRCGAQITAPPSAPPMGYIPYPPTIGLPRVQRHLQTLGTLWCAFGVYRVVASLLGFFVFRAMAWHRFVGDWPMGGHAFHGPPWLMIAPILVTMTVVMAALALFAGYSLLTRKPWARMLAIVLAILALFKFPLGTALGIYTLWVLAPASSAVEYDAIADPS